MRAVDDFRWLKSVFWYCLWAGIEGYLVCKDLCHVSLQHALLKLIIYGVGKGLLPDIQARCCQHKWTYQQDGAPAHTARNTTDYLKKEKIDFFEPDMWPQTAPILVLLTMVFGGPFSKSLPQTKI